MSDRVEREDVLNTLLRMDGIKIDKALAMGEIRSIPPTDELKFYYVDSIDDYWIGRRLDNFYYAEWVDELGFVWTRSRYLPWGEHVVNPQTLWKEYTYPSEPREIPFTEWIVGFIKKFTSEEWKGAE